MTENQMGGVGTTARDEGSQVAQHAKEAAGEVGSTVRDQAAQVTQEAKDQTRHVVQDVRQRVATEAEQQARRVSGRLGRIADELSDMAGNAPSDSMSAGAIRSAADTSRQAARFLDERGAQGLLDSARDFARRKPGTFLLGAAVAGFLVGRVAKSATGGGQSTSQGTPQSQGGVVPVASERPDPAPGYSTSPGYSTNAGYSTDPGYEATPGSGPTPGYAATPDYGAPLTPSAAPGRPAAGVPHVEP